MTSSDKSLSHLQTQLESMEIHITTHGERFHTVLHAHLDKVAYRQRLRRVIDESVRNLCRFTSKSARESEKEPANMQQPVTLGHIHIRTHPLLLTRAHAAKREAHNHALARTHTHAERRDWESQNRSWKGVANNLTRTHLPVKSSLDKSMGGS